MNNWSIRLQIDDRAACMWKQVSIRGKIAFFFLNAVMGFCEHFHDYGSWEFSIRWYVHFNCCELWVCMQTAFKLACVAKRFLSLANLVSICRSCQWRLNTFEWYHSLLCIYIMKYRNKKLKKKVKRCRDGTPKSMQTRYRMMHESKGHVWQSAIPTSFSVW